MPYIYAAAKTLGKTKKVGTTDCVALVQHYANAPNHAAWKAGESVLDNPRPVTARTIKSMHRQQNKEGTWYRASDKANAFSVIE
jgi:hypothetical protein